MSFMDRKNILSEGFFDFLKKFKKNKTNYSKLEKSLMKNPAFKKKYKKLEKTVDELEQLIKGMD